MVGELLGELVWIVLGCVSSHKLQEFPGNSSHWEIFLKQPINPRKCWSSAKLSTDGKMFLSQENEKAGVERRESALRTENRVLKHCLAMASAGTDSTLGGGAFTQNRLWWRCVSDSCGKIPRHFRSLYWLHWLHRNR